MGDIIASFVIGLITGALIFASGFTGFISNEEWELKQFTHKGHLYTINLVK